MSACASTSSRRVSALLPCTLALVPDGFQYCKEALFSRRVRSSWRKDERENSIAARQNILPERLYHARPPLPPPPRIQQPRKAPPFEINQNRLVVSWTPLST